MKYEILTVPTLGSEASEETLNQFVASVKMINISKELIVSAEQSFWSFCIYYNDISKADKKPKSRSRKQTIDYREILNDEQFTVYAQLREIRKTLSECDQVTIYAIFTNEQYGNKHNLKNSIITAGK